MCILRKTEEIVETGTISSYESIELKLDSDSDEYPVAMSKSFHILYIIV